jgi:GDPmannose 4,6-dehydratase
MRTALITGVTGQDGSYLSERLLEQGYHVGGLVVGIEDRSNIRHLESHPNFDLIEGELMDQAFLSETLRTIRPARLFNLAGQSFVPLSWKQPVFTADFNGLSVARLLEAIRLESPDTHFYQASSSEMFGNSDDVMISEDTILAPCSPYAAAKAFGHHITQVYRESYGLFACSGILFNHESPRRGEEFVTQKIARSVARIARGDREHRLQLGDPESRRDWGYAGDYVRAMIMMLDADEADDYVIATGWNHSVRDFCRMAFEYAGIASWEQYVEFNCHGLQRPKDVRSLCGNATKARVALGWVPLMTFKMLVEVMVDAAIRRLANEELPEARLV